MADAFVDLRAKLVRQISERGVLRDATIAEAFRAVPRHLFLPDLPAEEVYTDRSIAVKVRDGVPISSSSQPAMMAEMLEQLRVREGERVLEIGAGTGYNAALLATLAGEAGFVATVDLDDDLVAAARRHLDAAGFERVRTLCADGTRGDPDDAPFDAIIATVAVADVPRAWFEQLRPGGRLVMPLALRSMQKIVCFERTGASLASTSIVDGGFMMLRGTTPSVSAPPLALGDSTFVRVLDRAKIDAPALAAALRAPAYEVAPVHGLAVDEIWLSFGLWLALHDDAFCSASVSGPQALTTRVPDISGAPKSSQFGQAMTLGLACGDELVVFAARDDGSVALHAFGAAPHAVERMQTAIAAWHDAGRPRNDALHIEIVPGDAARNDSGAYAAATNAVTVDLPSARAIVRWNRR